MIIGTSISMGIAVTALIVASMAILFCIVHLAEIMWDFFNELFNR